MKGHRCWSRRRPPRRARLPPRFAFVGSGNQERRSAKPFARHGLDGAVHARRLRVRPAARCCAPSTSRCTSRWSPRACHASSRIPRRGPAADRLPGRRGGRDARPTASTPCSCPRATRDALAGALRRLVARPWPRRPTGRGRAPPRRVALLGSSRRCRARGALTAGSRSVKVSILAFDLSDNATGEPSCSPACWLRAIGSRRRSPVRARRSGVPLAGGRRCPPWSTARAGPPLSRIRGRRPGAPAARRRRCALCLQAAAQ